MIFPQNSSRQEAIELIRSQLQSRLNRENFQGAKQVLLPLQPVDVAEAIEKLPKAMQVIAFRLLPKDKAIASKLETY